MLQIFPFLENSTYIKRSQLLTRYWHGPIFFIYDRAANAKTLCLGEK